MLLNSNSRWRVTCSAFSRSFSFSPLYAMDHRQYAWHTRESQSKYRTRPRCSLRNVYGFIRNRFWTYWRFCIISEIGSSCHFFFAVQRCVAKACDRIILLYAREQYRVLPFSTVTTFERQNCPFKCWKYCAILKYAHSNPHVRAENNFST